MLLSKLSRCLRHPVTLVGIQVGGQLNQHIHLQKKNLTIHLSASISLSKKTVGVFQWAVAHDFVQTHGDLGPPGVPSRCIARLACCSQLPRPSPRSEGVDSKSPPIGRPRSCNKPGMAHPQRNGKDVLLQCV